MSISTSSGTQRQGSQERVSVVEHEHRMVIIADWLLGGRARPDVLQAIQTDWQVSLRTAQVYLFEAQRRLAVEAAEEEQLFYLRLSQHQRDRLIGSVLAFAQQVDTLDHKMIRSLTGLVTAACKLLDSRNATAAEIQKLVKPDSTPQTVLETVRQINEERRRIEEQIAQTRAKYDPKPSRRAAEPGTTPLTDSQCEEILARGSEQASPQPKPSDRPRKPNTPRPPSRHPDPMDELTRQFSQSKDPQVLPPIFGPEDKSKPDQEMGLMGEGMAVWK